MKKRIMIFLILIVVAVISYLGLWQYKVVMLSEAVMHSRDRVVYDECYNLVDALSKVVDIPMSSASPKIKAVTCEVEIDFLMNKFIKMTVYGITDLQKQNLVADFIKNQWVAKLPFKLVIYDRENWIESSSGNRAKGEENKVFEKWIR